MTISTTAQVPRAERPAPPRRDRRSTIAGVAVRTPYWVLTGALAIIFLFPLVWTAVASVSPRAATGQTDGYGFGNYETLIYLAQTEDPALDAEARRCAERLGLGYLRRRTGYGDLAPALAGL